jgi:hypothetical protein
MGSTVPRYTTRRHLLPILEHLPRRRTLRSSHRWTECLQVSAILPSLRRRHCDSGWWSTVLVGLGGDSAEDWWV